MRHRTKVLFILKLRHDYGEGYSESTHLSSGLYNSALFVVQMLLANGVDAELVQVVDGNSIDREVHRRKPTHVILEALWVTPEKLNELAHLHRRVKWIVRIHSDAPFIAQEGIAIKWLFEYTRIPRVSIGFNSQRMLDFFSKVAECAHLLYMPNYFPVCEELHHFRRHRRGSCDFNVGCFGAIRVMKNQLVQAMAAIQFANERKIRINFHVNRAFHGCVSGRAVLKNLRSLFANTDHRLIEHEWLQHEDFKDLLRQMDIGMQVSFSESFNIVAAQMASLHVPIVVSHEISWATWISEVNTTSVDKIATRMSVVYDGLLRDAAIHANVRGLLKHSEAARKHWLKVLSA